MNLPGTLLCIDCHVTHCVGISSCIAVYCFSSAVEFNTANSHAIVVVVIDLCDNRYD